MTRAHRTGRRLTRRFYRREAVALAQALLGMMLVRVDKTGTLLAGRIVETEAYLGEPDLAAHTAGGRRTPRNEAMYADAGHAYIYFTYGMHHCMNVVADEAETPTAVLIRALEPIDGLELMRVHRSGKRSADKLKNTDLCSGPAKLCQALALDRSLNGCDMTRSDTLFIERPGDRRKGPIHVGRRIGVDYANEWASKPLRFYRADCPHVSRRLKDDRPLEH